MGPEAPGLSASTIVRLKQVWQGELAHWQRRDLSARRYVYFWADGVYFSPRLDHDKQCMCVIIGADEMGRKELLAIADGYRESAQSWREVLLDLKRRGLVIAPELATGDAETVLVERSCAAHHGYEVGDRLHFRVASLRLTLTIAGIALSPEYLVAPLDPIVYAPSRGSLCVIFASLARVHAALQSKWERGLRDLFGGSRMFPRKLRVETVNSLLFRWRPDADRAAAGRAINALAENDLVVARTVRRGEQPGTRFLRLGLETFAVYLPAIVTVLLMAAMVAVLLVVARWILEARIEIGRFMALGYGKGRILLAYLLPGLIIAAVGCITGIVFAQGTLLGFGLGYARAIGMPDPELALSARHLASAAVVTTAVIGLATIGAVGGLLRLTPYSALRPAPPMVARSVTVWAPRWAGPLWWRCAWRNLARSPLASAATVLSVALALAVTISFPIALGSIERLTVRSFDRAVWSAVVDFTVPQPNSFRQRLADLAPETKWLPFVRGTAWIDHDGRRENVILLGYDPARRPRRLDLFAGRNLRPGDREMVVMERRLAETFGLAPGDTVRLDGSGSARRVRLVGLFSSPVPAEVHVPVRLAQRLTGIGQRATGLFLLGDPPSEDLEARLYALDQVKRVTRKPAIVATVLDNTSRLWVILNLASVRP